MPSFRLRRLPKLWPKAPHRPPVDACCTGWTLAAGRCEHRAKVGAGRGDLHCTCPQTQLHNLRRARQNCGSMWMLESFVSKTRVQLPPSPPIYRGRIGESADASLINWIAWCNSKAPLPNFRCMVCGMARFRLPAEPTTSCFPKGKQYKRTSGLLRPSGLRAFGSQ